MIRPEFFTRKDLTAAQRCFLEFIQAFAFTLESAATAFEKNLPDSILQVARRAGVIDELAQNAVSNYTFRSGEESRLFFDALLLACRAAESLRCLCTVGAHPFVGLAESRVFLGSLCRCIFDRLDWSPRRQILGSRYSGAGENDLELTIRELPLSMAEEHQAECVQALIDFHDTLLAAQDLFDVLREIENLSERLFPVRDNKYWSKG